MMEPSLRVNIPEKSAHQYPIWIEAGLLNQPAQWLEALPMLANMEHFVIITDDNIKPIYGEPLLKALQALKLNTHLLSFPAGEASKSRKTLRRIEEDMFKKNCNRKTLILALGGGVVGDMAGFLAATYMRGIPYIQLPTSLLAMIDSSVGGKTGIDTSFGKNLIGAFWQPKAVFMDIQCLNTLPKEHVINGFIEAIKAFIIKDAQSFEKISQNLNLLFSNNLDFLKMVITKAIQIKADIVQADEKEEHLRAILNFGHTIGHALEKLTEYNLLHGYAVGLGMLMEGKISQQLGLLPPHEYAMIENLLLNLGINKHQLAYFDIDAIIEATRLDKKNKSGKTHYVLLQNIGRFHEKGGVTHPVPDEVIKMCFNSLT